MPEEYYRLIVIYEEVFGNRRYLEVELDRVNIGNLGDETILSTRLDKGPHVLELMSGHGVEKTIRFTVGENQNITRVFVSTDGKGVNARLDTKAQNTPPKPRAQAVQEERPLIIRSAPAQQVEVSAPRKRSPFLTILVSFLAGVVCTTAFFYVIWPQNSAVPASTANASRPAAAPLEPTPTPLPQRAQVPSYLPNGVNSSALLGNFSVEIRGAERVRYATGEEFLVVSYAWTNNSGLTVSAATAMNERAFQNGVQLEPAANLDGLLGVDLEMRLRDVRPGTAVELQTAYRLSSPTAVVEFELAENGSQDETYAAMNFDLTALR